MFEGNFVEFLRQLLDGGQPEGDHEHECDTCGEKWQHGRDCIGNEAAHTCGNCGDQQWYVSRYIPIAA